MASVEPQERAKELAFLLRMLTEGAPPDTDVHTEARSYDWPMMRAPHLTSAEAIEIAMALLGPKVKAPKGRGGRPEVAGVGGATESAVIGEILKNKAAAQPKMTPEEAQSLFARGEKPTQLYADPEMVGQFGSPYAPKGQRQQFDDDINWGFQKPYTWETRPPDLGPSPWPGTKLQSVSEGLPVQGPVAPGPGTPATATPAEILRQIKEKGGYTVNLETGEVPASGIMAGKFANKDPRTRVIEGDPTMVDITSWAKQNEKVLKGPKADFAGFWHDKETGKTYLDVAKRFEPGGVRPATKFAEKTKQLSLYDIGKDEFPPVGDYPGFVSGKVTPEGVVPYAQRLREMNEEGAAYMGDKPNPDWWRTPNMDRVYGAETAPQRAGFMGAVSTNTQPSPNVQGFTEYMRRMIKGEPIIQPEFTIPETAMGGFAGPGKRMGLEKGRSFNLQRAAEGDLEAMRGDVVREKTQALTGNRLAMVLDRIHARLTEQPSAGIYAHSQEATFPTGKVRQQVKDAIIKEAEAAGLNPDTFSANVWAGVREHIKKFGELYGTQLKATQRTTSGAASKSYDDLFVDLIAKKAKHLGISVKQMEAKLRKGNGELLSYLLATTPVIAEAYKRSSGSQSEVVPPPSDVAP